MRKIIISIAIALMAFAANAQVGIQTETPRPNSVLDVESADSVRQGVLFPQASESNITLQDAVAVRPDSMVAVNNDGLLFYDATSKCFKYYNLTHTQWYSICGTPPPADTELGDCYQAVAMGTYMVNTSLTINNYLQLPIKVNRAGTYTITAIAYDAANNEETYYYTASGEFPVAGDFVVNVPGVGEPATFGNHTVQVTINGALQNCNIPVTVQPRDPDYSILSVEQLNPKWNILTPLADGTYKVSVKLLVYNPGTWGLTTSQVNGYTFGGTGEISQAQGYNPDGGFPQTVTVLVSVAAGQANVYGTGYDNFTMSTTTSRNASNSDFSIQLSRGGYKLNRTGCSAPDLIFHISKATAMQSTDTLTNGQYFVSDAYIKIPIQVTAPGQYVCYAEFAGVRFATCTDNGTEYVRTPVTLTSSTTSLTMYPVGPKDNSNPNRTSHTINFNQPIAVNFSAGDAEGPDDILGNADDWEPQTGYFQEDQFCRPQVVVKQSVARYASLVLAPQAPTTGASAYANGMRYSYDNRFISSLASQETAAKQAATQGTYTIDQGGNTAVTAINLLATYSVPGDYEYRINIGTGGDSIIYYAKGTLPAIPAGNINGTATISLSLFRQDADGNYLDVNGNIASISGFPPALNAWENGVQINALPATMPKGKQSDIIRFYTTADDPTYGGTPSGTLEVPIWFGFRTMKIVSMGGTDYSLNNPSSVGYSMLNAAINFGYNGRVAVGGIDLVRITTVPSTANSGVAMKDAIRDADVVLIQYPNGFGNSAFAQIFKEFVQKGGSLMYSCEDAGNVANVMQTIYGGTFTSNSPAGMYRVGIVQTPGTSDYTNNPILNGPFSKDSVNITAVGNDYGTGSYIATGINNVPNAVVLGYQSSNRVFMFYDPSNGLFYCADGGWLSSSGATNTSTTNFPIVTYSNYQPRAKANFSGTGCFPTNIGSGTVYNSYIFCNYLAWGIDWAATHRDHSGDATW
ncbi:hypothetical protein FACS189429_2960 [Bacteroidia bacterium]|nr:hypothetical protein FACS189429_2960 [Bacteroidia bacterium]GHV44523.1 hypothetical protein FACS1894180_5970 [Bacteroidia bacterium]